MLFTRDYPDNFVLQEIDKIVRKRWRRIERTTRYGWLTACSHAGGSAISHQDAETLSALANKVGYESCMEALDRIRNMSQDLHPNCVPAVAAAVLDETYTAIILSNSSNSNRRRDSRWESNTSLKDLPPTIFTISRAIFSNTAIQRDGT